MYQLKRLPCTTVLLCVSFQFMLRTVNVKSWKQAVFLSEQCTMSKVIVFQKCSFSVLTQAHNCLAACLLPSIMTTRCSKSAQKFAVQVCHVATVVMATTQLVLCQFKNFSAHQLRIEWGLSLPKTVSKCCKLAKLCHNNHSGPVFSRQCISKLAKLRNLCENC